MPPTTEHVFFAGLAPVLLRRRPYPKVTPRLLRSPDRAGVDGFLVWLLGQAGLSADNYRARSLARRLPACLRILRVGTVEEARRRLEERPELQVQALDAVLLGVTEFFRDHQVFAALRERLLPELLSAGNRVRIWSAACSEGHELYSVAMLLDEMNALAKADLLGTDCRASAIAVARAGAFASDAVHSLEPRVREKYFSAFGRTARIAEPVRAATRWEQQDLFSGAAPGPWDVILWRNMAIYLEAGAAEATWFGIWRELRPGGILVAGKADHPPREIACERVMPCVFRKGANP